MSEYRVSLHGITQGCSPAEALQTSQGETCTNARKTNRSCVVLTVGRDVPVVGLVRQRGGVAIVKAVNA